MFIVYFLFLSVSVGWFRLYVNEHGVMGCHLNGNQRSMNFQIKKHISTKVYNFLKPTNMLMGKNYPLQTLAYLDEEDFEHIEIR